MTPQIRRWRATGKALLNLVISKSKILLQQLSPSESAEYKTWRHRFLLNRLPLIWAILIVWLLGGVYFFLITSVSAPETYTKLRDNFIYIGWLMYGVEALLLIACFALQKTHWGRCHPKMLFLCQSWSMTVSYQVVATLYGFAFLDGTQILVPLVQAIFAPVYWWLHLVSNLLPMVYFLGVNSALGLKFLDGRPLSSGVQFVSVFWLLIVIICQLGVYIYERLQRKEFEARRELQVFLHSVSHDLRTPEMATSMVLQNLLDKSSADTVTVKRNVLERLLQGSDRQLNLINSLMEAHNTEVQGIVLHCEPCQVSTVVRSVLSDLEAVVVKNQVIINNRVNADLPLIHADPTQLWRVYSNLISNALKHNPHGITLTLDATLETKAIRCSVEDNGVGMSQELVERLFQLYVRGHRSRYMPGLGLGLYLCRRIVETHGGKVGVSSNPGKGSTFWFTLPLHSH